jgi:acetolactate synthase I/II/III large subunit
MNGAESLVRTLVDSGIDVCFANPGTSEMHFVSAIDKVDGLRSILVLFEGVATGAADGYGRIARKPAVTLLHLGPGLSNGLANLHNARRASTPIVNIVGDHATYHAQYDAPLASDIAGFARPVSGWIHASTSSKTVGAEGARAVQAARSAPGQIATLILPADAAWNEAERASPKLAVLEPASVPSAAVDDVAKALSNGKRTALLLRDAGVLTREGLEQAGRIAAKSKARILCDTFTPRIARGAGVVAVERIPYFAEQIVEFLKDVEQLVLVGAKPPVTFFAYPGKPSYCTPEGTKVLHLSQPHEDGLSALAAVAEAIGASHETPCHAPLIRPDLPTWEFNSFTVGQIIAHYLPEGAVISDEAATSRAGADKSIVNANAHDHLSLMGGSIGQGLPVATGAAVAAPERKILALQGDGGAMYTLQSLWTQARERLDVTTIIFANRSYAILNVELARVGAGNPGPKALSMLDLHNPELNWVKLANGMGVEAARAESNARFAALFEEAMNQRGPRLIEVML